MNNINLKRVMLASLMIILLLSATGCFIKPDPIDTSLNPNFEPEIPLPTVTEIKATPTSTVSIDFSDWATPNISTPTPIPSTQATELPDQNGDASSQPQTSTKAESSSGGALKEGAKGQEVRELQQRLQDLGYYTRTVDGTFGAGTTAALKDFQKANGLSTDGIAGPKTMEILNSSNAKMKEDANSNAH